MTNIRIQKQRGILLMRGALIDICVPSISPTVFSFQMSPEVYAEMEITNVDLATKQLVDFFSIHNIPSADFILIIQTPLFRKEFSLAPQEKLESSINLYLDYIPFDSVLSKRIKTDDGVLVLAANGDLIQNLCKMFSTSSSTIECVTALDSVSIIPKGFSVLTHVSAETMLKSASLIKQESFSLTPQRSNVGFQTAQKEEETKEKSMLPLLIPVFIILMIILGIVYYLSQSQSNINVSKRTVITPSP